MPKITINEVDLTKASLQPSQTDISFVPGFTCLSSYPDSPTLCENIADFEKNFGTYPAITAMYRRYAYKEDQYDDTYVGINPSTTTFEANKYYSRTGTDPDYEYTLLATKPNDWDETTATDVYFERTEHEITAEKGELSGYKKYRVKSQKDFADNFYDEIMKNTIYKNGVPTEYSNGSLAGSTQVVLAVSGTPTESEVDTWLSTSGFMVDGAPSGNTDTDVATSYFDFEYDISYIYAKELIRSGVPVIYYVVKNLSELNNAGTQFENGTTYVDMLSYIKSAFAEDGQGSVNIHGPGGQEDGILDRGEYSFKYVTSGGYPSVVYYKDGDTYALEETGASQFCSDLLKIAGTRGDCVALIDMGDSTLFESSTDSDKTRNFAQEQMLDPSYLWNAVTSDAFMSACGNYAEYGSIFAPWALYTTQSSYYVEGSSHRTDLPQLSTVIMPPSFGYLMALAQSIYVNNNWVAVAGVARGKVPYINGLYTASRLSNAIAEYWQPRNGKISVNPITNIKPYGLTIWGNRTMKNNLVTAMGGEDGLTSTSFLNIRNMVSDVKKTAYVAAKTLMFEQNSDVLWVNFLSRVTPLLDRLMSGQGLSDYKVIQNPTDEKAKMKATIKLFPIYAVEDFEITIELSDEDVSVI